MIFRPERGDTVEVHYRKSARELMKMHLKVGVIVLAARGPGPHNAAVKIDGETFVIPKGNLMEVKE